MIVAQELKYKSDVYGNPRSILVFYTTNTKDKHSRVVKVVAVSYEGINCYITAEEKREDITIPN